MDGNLDLSNDLNFYGENYNISNNSGLTFYKDTTDASNVMTVKNAQGYLKFNSFILMLTTQATTVLHYFY